jgi:LysM repeat protein
VYWAIEAGIFEMSTYTKIRFLLGLGAIFVFVYMLDGLPCLGDANELDGRISSIRMFQNNSKLPASSHEISLGQSLVVPKLIASELDKINIWGVFPSSMFEKVESIGRRHISTDKEEAKGVQYVVKEGDSLWSIAAEQLGNGSRYKEISKLNANVLKNDHDLTIGMQLSLPDP